MTGSPALLLEDPALRATDERGGAQSVVPLADEVSLLLRLRGTSSNSTSKPVIDLTLPFSSSVVSNRS